MTRRLLPIAAAALFALPALAASTLAERLSEEALKALRRDSRQFRQTVAPAERSGDWLDVRAVLHAHSRLSHDSVGTEAQLVAAAKAAGVRAVFTTEHPTPERKWATDGLRGEKDGVLFVPGAELSDGLLVWRDDGTRWKPSAKAGEVLQALQGTGAVTFVAHPEGRETDADWELPAFHGMEIYNSHADAMDSGYEEFLASFRKESPLKLVSMLNTLKRFPKESFAQIWDEQVEVLKRWDRLNEGFLAGTRRVVGIAANDSHQNVGVSFDATEEGLAIRDALGKTVGEVPKEKLPVLFLGTLKPGSTILAHTFDPYEVSFGYVSTHLLANDVSEAALFDALLTGRAYIAFDWLGAPSGFRCYARAGEKMIEMGGDALLADKPVLTVRPNTRAQIRLLRNGTEIQRIEEAELTHEVKDPGVYRAEIWVPVGAQWRAWISTNPIYIK
jgi:hypothetical protein